MPAVEKEKMDELEDRLNQAASELKQITTKKMFGCHALFANENVFALVWKHGQIGVKLTDEGDYKKLLSLKGASPWKAGPMTMSHWVLVPDSVQASPLKLKPWVRLAYSQALLAPPKTKRTKSATSRKISRQKK